MKPQTIFAFIAGLIIASVALIWVFPNVRVVEVEKIVEVEKEVEVYVLTEMEKCKRMGGKTKIREILFFIQFFSNSIYKFCQFFCGAS